MTGWLTLAGAIVVALITAVTTDRRLSRQIKDSGERQERELTAEAERQDAALAHDRELADLADLRLLLDGFAVALDRGRSARDEMVLLSQTARHIQPTLEQQARETAAAAEQSGRDLLALTVRLQVRLGPSDPITVAAYQACDALHAMWQQVCMLPKQDDFSGSHSIISTANGDFIQATAAYIAAAVERAGTVAGVTASSRSTAHQA